MALEIMIRIMLMVIYDSSKDLYGLWWVDCNLTQVMRIILTHLITCVKGWAEVILEIVVNLYYHRKLIDFMSGQYCGEYKFGRCVNT